MSHIKNARFICADPSLGEHVPIFKKEFTLKKKPKSALLEISALGVYEAHLNGKRVGNFIMAPGWTEYEKRVQYQSYDVFEMLNECNTLTVGVGHGWYCSQIGFAGKHPLNPYPVLIAALHLEYEDGTSENIITDESWLFARSVTVSSTIYDGEITDARIEAQYNENARLFDFDTEKLVMTDGEIVCENERFPVMKEIITPRGERVFDFGQNLTGYVEFKTCGRAGERITVSFAEILDKDGNFYNENYRSAKSIIEYTLRDGEQTYKPKYTFFGFRYAKIEGDGAIGADSVTAIAVHSDMKRTGWFECGHEKINKLYKNVIWGQKDNFLDVPTDCPQRDERLGWTGDAQVFCRTAMLNYDCRRFFKKWLRDLALAQYADGGIPRVVPNVINEAVDVSVENFGRRHSAAWADAATICPYEYYMAYGDVDFLRECYPVMKKWVSYVENNSENYLWNSGFHYGDWLALDKPDDKKGATDYFLIATAFFYHSARLTAKAAKIIGEDASHLESIIPKIREAFQKKYIKGSRLTSDTQTAYVLALHFGLASDEERDPLAKRLIELIEERGDALCTGFVGTPYLLDCLTEIGRSDKAYTLLLREKFPSWLYSVNLGATTIWEHWDGINESGEVWSKDMNSFNHYAYGSVAAWMYRTACGIKYDESHPAYKHFYIEPIPDARLGSARATLKTEYGEILSAWRYTECGKIEYLIEIPEASSATVTLGGVTRELKSGKYCFTEAPV